MTSNKFTSDAPLSEVLNLAADHIEHRGWVVGHGWPVRGTVELTDVHHRALCLEGAIAAALDVVWETTDHADTEMEDFQACPAYRAVQRYLGWDRSLWVWNDSVASGKDAVIAVLRAAALNEAVREHEEADAEALVEYHT